MLRTKRNAVPLKIFARRCYNRTSRRIEQKENPTANCDAVIDTASFLGLKGASRWQQR